MAASMIIRRIIANNIDTLLPKSPILCQLQQVRTTLSWTPSKKPKPGIKGKSYRRFIHWEDEYTIKPLQVTNLAGRDPITGRKVCIGIGGGIKHKYHWIKWKRTGPTDPEAAPKEEKVLEVFIDGCRTAHVALVGSGTELKYILATENMKPGQIIKTLCAIPRMAVRAYEGDAYPLGALPIGTIVHCVEKYPRFGGCLIHAAGTFGTILRKDGLDRVIVEMPSKKLFSLHETCMATVGRLSNIDHINTPIGSAQKNRELGNRPRSGLWHRKDGRFGRKIRAIPPPIKYDWGRSPNLELYVVTHPKYNTNADAERKPTVPIFDQPFHDY
ncbi:39S ribosomal protein L2, mitochondrial [Chelonus insularis]|uniref:39S ribosomal protein L2, mitochondrial n=1 Tax=Chelonus insularis TaxID=460826 RepID=UPI00158CF34B|nr:39S ribosomal protein L2, mitochondrial [Chelonus insularis]